MIYGMDRIRQDSLCCVNLDENEGLGVFENAAELCGQDYMDGGQS